MTEQISIDDLLREEEKPVKIVIPSSSYTGERVYTIPDDVWKTRCNLCVHKNGAENIPVPLRALHKQQYSEIIPCRIMSVSRPNDKPGECMSFRPKLFEVAGICESCIHNSQFAEGFCTKKDHAEQLRVYWGKDFGGDERNRDYWGRHTLSVCADYEPNQYVKEG